MGENEIMVKKDKGFVGLICTIGLSLDFVLTISEFETKKTDYARLCGTIYKIKN